MNEVYTLVSVRKSILGGSDIKREIRIYANNSNYFTFQTKSNNIFMKWQVSN